MAREADRPLWRLATRRGWRRAVRSMLRNITPKHVSKLEALHQSGTGNVRLEAGQRFGAVRKEAGRPVSSVDNAVNEQCATPAVAGTR